ncbi:hypothetical protein GJ744_001307 [Endocarpon pusillum]|uniref:Uncharacterized protein n=1 Tax=Endocarpon pusillum TaxID=364733 RepID=A0A8H7AAA4_9EURO|nr:hypothetical protein GJ744_001307 [Endocarpon pusillum]
MVKKRVEPLAAFAGVTMFEMLSEMIGSKELLRLITLAKLVNVYQVLDTCILVIGKIGKCLAAITTCIF